MELQSKKLGTPEIEEFLRGLYRRQGDNWDIVAATLVNPDRDDLIQVTLKMKLKDCKRLCRSLRRDYINLRGDLVGSIRSESHL